MPAKKTNWWKKWIEPPVIIAAVAVFSGWYVNHDAIKGLRDTVAMLVSMQSEPVRQAAATMMAEKTPASPEVQKEQQQQVRALAAAAPKSLGVWKAVGAVATYQSAAYAPVSFPLDNTRPCENKGKWDGRFVSPDEGVATPISVLPLIDALARPLLTFSGCVLKLDDIRLDGQARSIFFNSATIIFSGAPLPRGVTIVFLNCTFHLDPTSVPDKSGQELLLAVADSAPDKPIVIKSQS